MTHDTGLVLAQTDVAATTNEALRLKDLLSGLATRMNLRGAILTVDALHAVRETARWLHTHGIEFVMTVKENIQTLPTQCTGPARLAEQVHWAIHDTPTP